MEILTKSETSAILKIYHELSQARQSEVRKRAMENCEISTSTFYLWLRKPHMVSKVNRTAMARAFKMKVVDLFPEDE